MLESNKKLANQKNQQKVNENIEVLKNLDFITRTKNVKKILFSSDYFDENRVEVALELAKRFEAIYGRECAVIDLGEGSKINEFNVEYQNAREFEWLLSGEDLNDRKLDTHLRNLEERYALTFVIQDVKRNAKTTPLPEVDIDGAIVIRSDRSIGPRKSRHVTNMLKDANIPVLGMIYNRSRV